MKASLTLPVMALLTVKEQPVCTGHTYYGAPMGNDALPGS